ncbi:MAG: hypothetical protein COV34_00655 [Candidatus Zambryskibacteria bacterium CG10_big_fil_rev_8_21_14_0_10_42_12]|uniref:Uncharacterized protein n=1 Tax=Candidatus Zambryskibacteria bacterium CG10_big_fil_rev_8_21_14_0_10_42_12 TaxID=1975115 RepID=A0A2H0QXN7_9BACT|nr:MAG: hypothetical protein COV34_00655 [Candidatus Zambryskibacteria bacterium CG10_big_fil_rev_8_21_14_0_10_42_12]
MFPQNIIGSDIGYDDKKFEKTHRVHLIVVMSAVLLIATVIWAEGQKKVYAFGRQTAEVLDQAPVYE